VLPECFVAGYRVGKSVPRVEAEFLDRAWNDIASCAGKTGIAVVLGTERIVDGTPVPAALVIDASGVRVGFQEKVQLDPSEEGTYAPGSERRIFHAGRASLLHCRVNIAAVVGVPCVPNRISWLAVAVNTLVSPLPLVVLQVNTVV
jgi:predicted amidohydrolase